MARVVRNRNFKRDMARRQNHRGWTRAATYLGRSALRRRAPKDTNLLSETFEVTSPPPTRIGPRVRYSSRQKYALYPEVGTGLYGPKRQWIYPKRARVLTWVDRRTGTRIYARRVRGQRPQRYFRKAMVDVYGPQNVRYYGARRL